MTGPYRGGQGREGMACWELRLKHVGEVPWILQPAKRSSLTLLNNVRLCFSGVHAKISTEWNDLQNDMLSSQIHSYLPL